MYDAPDFVVLVCGDRNWQNRASIEAALHSLNCEHAGNYIKLIHGACRGADRMAESIARDLGWAVVGIPADWKRYGYAAGPIRNQQMLEQRPDLVLAFHSDLENSKGTKDMVRRARRASVPVVHFTG